MLQVAIIGLDSFGIRMLEELNEIDCEVIILDKNQEVIDKYKDYARNAFVTDAINKIALQKCIPQDIDAAIVDLGDNLEASIMTTNFLHKIGIKKIITKAQDDEHGEILKLVGATDVIYPDLDAAQRLTPMLASKELFNYMQISEHLSLAEVGVIADFDGKSLVEANVRQVYKLNVVAVRESTEKDFSFINSPDFKFAKGTSLLVAGTEKDIQAYLEKEKAELKSKKKSNLRKMFFRK